MQTRYQQLLSDVKKGIREIDAQSAAKLDNSSCYFIDVREVSEWQNGHLPNAVHISRGILEGSIEKLVTDPSSMVVVYCAGGGRSALAAESLMRMGYTQVYSLQGGFGGWMQQGLPVSNS